MQFNKGTIYCLSLGAIQEGADMTQASSAADGRHVEEV